MAGGLEVRVEEIERDIIQVKKDVGQINVDMTLLAQRQENNAKAISDLSNTISNNHAAQIQLMQDIAKTGNETNNKLGFIKGAFAVLCLLTVGSGGAVATVGNESAIELLKMIAGLFL